MMTTDDKIVQQQVNQWLDDVVIGLNLCPFAAKPQRNHQIRIAVSNANSDPELIEFLCEQLVELSKTSPNKLETTLVVTPNMLSDFDDYLFFADWLNDVIKTEGWEGIFQVATFHPDYCFFGSTPDDSENLTNRSPYPIFHLIREESMEKILAHYPNPEAIPDENIKKMNLLTKEQLRDLFPHINQK
jgi:uncharacterized protein